MSEQSSSSARFYEPPDEGWVQNKPGTVYNCAALVVRDAGRFVATSAGLPLLTASGPTEADALDGLTLELARFIRDHKAAGRAGHPWAARPEDVSPPAALRFVMVRL